MSIHRDELQRILFEWTNEQQFQDYCPNGLQVEGKEVIHRVVTGVTASQALVDKAIETEADAILVHHGYFWKGENSRITGMKRARLKALLTADINLFAYHLPLDTNAEFGNNVGLAKALELTNLRPLETERPHGIVYMGELSVSESLSLFVKRLEKVVARPLTACVEGGQHEISKVALCTGGGQSFIDAAADAGADLFISGEISEQTVHVAREREIHYLAAGHHATERFGVKALGEKLAQNFKLDVEFIDIDSPA